MPTYVYRRADGSTFELFQRITDAPLTHDPETGQPVVRMISGGAGLQFKGTGFYLTDYARKGAEGEKPAKAEGKESKTETKTESTPAAKPDSGAAGPKAE
jgi:predicted nucleic acid-binding Zn ribbon protein